MAEKIKKKYRQKQIGKKPARIFTDGSRLKQQNTEAAEWLKDQGFLDDEVSVENADVGETIDLKKTSGATIAAKNIVKKYRNLARIKPYRKRPARIFTEDNNDVEDIIDLGDIATLEPSKNAQIAAKKISEKYKNMRNKKNTKKAKADNIDFKITNSRAVDDDIDFNITDSKVITNQNAEAAAKKISQKYKNIIQKKALKLLKLAASKIKAKVQPLKKCYNVFKKELAKNIKE